MNIPTDKMSNPKDSVGVRKWRQFATVPQTVIAEVGVGMLEGARKYGRHNYRVAGVRASVYVDAAMGHVAQWWEGEDIDLDSGLSHITKAICSLVVLRDAMIQDMLADDRPPKATLDKVRADLQKAVEAIFTRHPDPLPAFTEAEHGLTGALRRPDIAGFSGPAVVNVEKPLSDELLQKMTDRFFSGGIIPVKSDSHGE